MFVVVKTCCQNETHQSKKCFLNNSIASFSVKVAVQLAGVTDKNGEPVYKKIQLRFIDSMRFMQSSLSDLVDNLAETNTDGLKCCRDPALELLEIDASYKARYECGKCGSILEKQLNKESLKRRFANLRKICSCRYHLYPNQ